MATDQAAAKKLLMELAKREDLGNRVCVDCANPNPQWASISFAVLLCLQCAGVHRGFGVHISFVRSITMDTWQEDQLRRMQAGGNKPFKAFMGAYGPQGGYTVGASPHDTYHCWAATEYKAKLDADLAGTSWSPSAPPADTPSAAPAGLRKARAASGRAGTPPIGSPPASQKSANENYFARLGASNASRPEDLPPSQGGRYTGFGSTPSPSPGAAHPSFGLSSRAAPSLSDLQDDPVGALGKGWSLFTAAVAGAGRVVTENVVQPGLAAVQDPAFQQSVRGYVDNAGKVASAANDWGRTQLGVDVGGAVGGVRDRFAGGHPGGGYSSVQGGGGGYGGYGDHEESSALYRDDDDELFTEYKRSQAAANAAPGAGASMSSASASRPAAKKNDGWDDDWKDF